MLFDKCQKHSSISPRRDLINNHQNKIRKDWMPFPVHRLYDTRVTRWGGMNVFHINTFAGQLGETRELALLRRMRSKNSFFEFRKTSFKRNVRRCYTVSQVAWCHINRSFPLPGWASYSPSQVTRLHINRPLVECLHKHHKFMQRIFLHLAERQSMPLQWR